MIETLINSKTRIKILKLFLSHIDDRYYLRELERMLDESLSPLRRQLIKLTNIGILVTEEEANLKYYKLNKNFEGLEELRRLVMGKEESRGDSLKDGSQEDGINPLGFHQGDSLKAGFQRGRQFRYDLALLSFISVFVLVTAIFVGYVNMKNIKQVANIISGEPISPPKSSKATSEVLPVGNGEMASSRWKIMPGNVPVLSSGETGEDKNSKEL